MKPPATPIVLIPDNGPLGALAINGQDKLDSLFAFGVPVHITDMVIEEATRNKSLWWNKDISEWLARNKGRYTRVETATGVEYLKNLALWERAGRPPDLEPKRADKGDRSIQDAIEAYEGMKPSETIVAFVDERNLRKRLLRADVNIELVCTRSLFEMIEKDLHLGNAETMWRMVKNSNPKMDNINHDVVHRGVPYPDGEVPDMAPRPPWVKRR